MGALVLKSKDKPKGSKDKPEDKPKDINGVPVLRPSLPRAPRARRTKTSPPTELLKASHINDNPRSY